MSTAQFDQFVRENADGFLRTAYLIVWDAAEAEDLVQESLLVIARRWPRVRRMEHPRAYARRVLVNLALDGSKRRRRRRAEVQLTEEAAPDVAADVLEAVDVRADLVAALAELPPRQRAVLVLRYFEDLTEAQTAAALGCSTGTVKSTASRALARLQRELTTETTQGIQR